MASSMRARLGESLATVSKFDVPIQQATTRSLDALKAYALGVAQRAKGDETGAIPFLEHAVILDPAFASAHSALSAIYGSLGEIQERTSHAQLAYDNRHHVTERELGWSRGRPREYDFVGAQAQALAYLGQMTRARSLYQRTLELARRQALAQVALGYAAQAAWTEAVYGNDREALVQARDVLGRDPSAAPRLRAAAGPGRTRPPPR